jgi:hypothetical protein
MPDTIIDGDALCVGYFAATQALMRRVTDEEREPLDKAVSRLAAQVPANRLGIRTVTGLVEQGLTPPVWRSGDAPGGDEANVRFIAEFQGLVKAL